MKENKDSSKEQKVEKITPCDKPHREIAFNKDFTFETPPAPPKKK